MGSFVKENSQNEKLFRTIVSKLNDPGQFSTTSNIRVTKVSTDYAEGELTVTKSSLNPHGIVHGGCLATLADTVGGAAVVSSGRACVTLNYSMSFLSPAKGTKIKCVATPRKVGKTVSVIFCELTDDEGNLVATSELTYYLVEMNRFRDIEADID